MLSCRILAAYAPLRDDSSESVRRNTIVKLYNVRLRTTEFRNYLFARIYYKNNKHKQSKNSYGPQ